MRAEKDAVVVHDGVRRTIRAGTEVPGGLQAAYADVTGQKPDPVDAAPTPSEGAVIAKSDTTIAGPNGLPVKIIAGTELSGPIAEAYLTSTGEKRAGGATPSDDVPEPLEGYGDLSADDVVKRLGDLSPSEVEAVKAYEAAHKGRKTVLNHGK